MYTTYGTGFGKFSQTYHIGTQKPYIKRLLFFVYFRKFSHINIRLKATFYIYFYTFTLHLEIIVV